jgi:hypothetical protein
MFHEDLAEALTDAAVDLAVHDRRIDDGADVVDSHVALDGNCARLLESF